MERSLTRQPGKRSLASRLLVLWALSLVASVAVGLMLLQLSRQSDAAQTARAEAVVARACGLIGDRYAFYAAGWRVRAEERERRGLPEPEQDRERQREGRGLGLGR